jgi:hypothetical protein
MSDATFLYAAPDIHEILELPDIWDTMPSVTVDPFLFLQPLVQLCGDAKFAARMWAACDDVDMAIAMWHLAQYTDINVLILCKRSTEVLKAVMDAVGVKHE